MSEQPGAPDLSFNAGQSVDPYNLELTRADAQARATATGKPVRVYRHVGGVHPSKPGRAIAPSKAYMWRDVLDGEGRNFPAPRFWEAVETLEAERVQ